MPCPWHINLSINHPYIASNIYIATVDKQPLEFGKMKINPATVSRTEIRARLKRNVLKSLSMDVTLDLYLNPATHLPKLWSGDITFSQNNAFFCIKNVTSQFCHLTLLLVPDPCRLLFTN